MSSVPGLPPLKSLLKSTVVEDPINVYVHRTAAYGFVKAIWHTPITPNMITFLSVVVGAASGAMYLWGTREAMIAAGALLWTAAILDGADGILARAKNMQSQFGRALDGWADMMVAIFTVIPAFWHVWVAYQNPIHLPLMVIAIVTTTIHLSAYDYYKELYLRMTPGRGSEGEELEDAEKRIEEARSRGFMTFIAVKHVLLPYLRQQKRTIRLLDPTTREQRDALAKTEESRERYRKENLVPMRLFSLVSLAPHSYLMAWFSMADRLDIYVWVRSIAMNLIFFVAVFLQRRATRRSLAAIAAGDAG
ncbi:MAG: CDP-alcohol phosphatidyltransferase family protein [Myxococcota bacterium]